MSEETENFVPGLEVVHALPNSFNDTGTVDTEHGWPAFNHEARIKLFPVQGIESNGFQADGDFIGSGAGLGDRGHGKGASFLDGLVLRSGCCRHCCEAFAGGEWRFD